MLYADLDESFWLGGSLSTDEAKIIDAVGMGAMIFGGGLVIGGIARMVLRR